MLEELTLEYIPKIHKDIAKYIGIDAFKKLVNYKQHLFQGI
ncbi:hypothetical protein QUV80_12970 [Paraclostridium benzoelyticum]|nr:hypothetical protein [Paraclostridium benzoelyticum]